MVEHFEIGLGKVGDELSRVNECSDSQNRTSNLEKSRRLTLPAVNISGTEQAKVVSILLTKACLTKDESQVTLNNMRILLLTQKVISSRRSLKVTVRVFVNLTETDVFVSCFSSYKMNDLYLTCVLYSVQGDVDKCFINKFE